MQGVWYSVIVVCFRVSPTAGAAGLDSAAGGMLGSFLNGAQKQINQVMVGGLTANDAMGKLQDYGNAARRVLGNIPLTGTPSDKVNALISTATAELAKQMPYSVGIGDMEVVVADGSKYVCGREGLIFDLRSIVELGSNMVGGQGDYTDLHMRFAFGDFHLHFNNFVLHVKQVIPVTLRGKIDMAFKENELEFVLKIPKVSKIVSALSEKCVVYVKDFKVNNIGSPEVLLSARSHIRKHFAQEKLVEALSQPKEKKMIKEKIEVKVPEELQVKLSQSKSWICVDQALLQSVQARRKTLNEPEFSDDFESYCMDNEWEEE